MTIEDALIELNKIGTIERLLINRDRPTYHYNGGILNWGEDLSPDVMERLNNAEVFILNDKDGKPSKYIFRDAYHVLREGSI